MADCNDEIHVHCPNCNIKRLFDTVSGAEGMIKIKCPACKSVAVISLHNVTQEMKQKRMRAYARALKAFE